MSAVDDLAAALAADDAAEASGMHPNDRVTCWQDQSWADHAHNPITNERMTVAEFNDRYGALQVTPFRGVDTAAPEVEA